MTLMAQDLIAQEKMQRSDRAVPRAIRTLCVLWLLTASTAWALSSDREQELEINADGNTVISNVEGTRTITVKQNVFIKQGSMELRGEQAIFEYDQRDGELRRVTVSGGPASFQQQADGSDGIITGSSEVIHYYTGADNRIEFIGKAHFTQEGSVMDCVEIKHSISSGNTEMTGPCSGTFPPQIP